MHRFANLLGAAALLALTSCVSAPKKELPDCVATAKALIPAALAVLDFPEKSIAFLGQEQFAVFIPEPPSSDAKDAMVRFGALDVGGCLFEGKKQYRVYVGQSPKEEKEVVNK